MEGNPNMKGLSRPTFNAALQTSGAFPPLIDYLLGECNRVCSGWVHSI